MKDTPRGNRTQVAIIGDTNSGKSALFNAILGVEASIVSNVSGTTTDSVMKNMELLPYGPITLIDTAGLDDRGALGELRMNRTEKVISAADFIIVCVDVNDAAKGKISVLTSKIKAPFIVVYTKADTTAHIADLPYVSIRDKESINKFRSLLAKELQSYGNKEKLLTEGILNESDTAVLVVPIDGEAPKGRLILPQAQFIRECLDRDIVCVVTTPGKLNEALANCKKVDFVVTDSQVFKEVGKVVPKHIPLSSFSILVARQKGDLQTFVYGAKSIANLKENSTVLIAESCLHAKNHEDIGSIKIPATLNKLSGKNLRFEFISDSDFDTDLSKYALIIHCGGCMATSRELTHRCELAAEQGVPITNYGIVLSMCAGTLERSLEAVF